MSTTLGINAPPIEENHRKGSIIFAPGQLADELSELAGYKAGLALSLPELCDHLAGSEYPDIICQSEGGSLRLRAEEYEFKFYKLLNRIGYTETEYDGDYTGAKRFQQYTGHLDEFQQMGEIFACSSLRKCCSAA